MKHTSASFFRIVFLLLSFTSLAQSQTAPVVDSVKMAYPQRYGLRVGADLFRLSRNIWDKNYTGFELHADYRYNKKVFLATELGSENKYKADDQLSFTTQGSFLKIGLDYNMHNNWMDLENMIYVGGRYGISLHRQTLHSYKIFNQDNYFGETEVFPELETTGLTAHWIDLVGGIRTKVFSNVFMGFSVRLSYLITQKQPEGFENLYIPGYGEKFSGNIGASFNYSVSYFIPLYKKKPEAGAVILE